ncbi:MAG: hypothetical protein QOG54_764 [Actinomycetota bacterium]|nr:hypothetical protein [Actinomycetota bacterium]
MGTSQVDFGERARGLSPPWTVWAVVVLLFILEVAQTWIVLPLPGSNSDVWVNEVLRDLPRVAQLGLVAIALLRGGRIGWGLVLSLQLLTVVYAVRYVLDLPSTSPLFSFVHIGDLNFAFGWLPLIVGVANLILLLLPPTRRWTSGQIAWPVAA